MRAEAGVSAAGRRFIRVAPSGRRPHCHSGRAAYTTGMTEDSHKKTKKNREKRRGQNVGTVDRVISGIVGAGMLALGIWQATRAPWRLVIGILGPPLLVRAALGKCALYRALGVDTCHGKRRHEEVPATT